MTELPHIYDSIVLVKKISFVLLNKFIQLFFILKVFLIDGMNYCNLLKITNLVLDRTKPFSICAFYRRIVKLN